MIVMPSNCTGFNAGFVAGQYPTRFGWLMSPDGWRRPQRGLPYALDNGAYTAFTSGEEWDSEAFVGMLEKAKRHHAPSWVLAPDVVQDRDATIALWHEWGPALRDYGWPLAFAVQDGMTQTDVPADADVIFVGGSTDWKWRTVWDWCKQNRRVHVGRVNSYRLLWNSHDAGAESCDGTGWFRGRQEQLAELEQYLAESSAGGRPQQRLIA